MTDSASRNHMRGQLESVVGRANARGIPEVSEAVFRMEDGSMLEARLPPPAGLEVTFQALPVVFGFVDFGVCPLCLHPDADTKEHVPPHSIGGRVLTLTCERCNNEFGSQHEPHLRDWYDNSIGKVRLSGADVKGKRVAGEYPVRENTAGGFILIQRGDRDPSVESILHNGTEFEMTYYEADTARAHLAAVKTAYLAACTALRAIPRTPHADALRAELLAARDVPRTQRLKLSSLMSSIRVSRSRSAPAPGEILLMATTEPGGVERYALGFSRVFAVDWPLDPITGFHVYSAASDATEPRP